MSGGIEAVQGVLALVHAPPLGPVTPKPLDANELEVLREEIGQLRGVDVRAGVQTLRKLWASHEHYRALCAEAGLE